MAGLLATIAAIAKIPIEALAKWRKKQARQAKIKKQQKIDLIKEKQRWKLWREDRLKHGKELEEKNTAAIVKKARKDIAALDENPY